MGRMNKEAVPTTESARRRNPRGQGDRLRSEILAAVGRLLDEKLTDNPLPVSLREVAREVGIAAQSMYLHFADKDQLARAVAEDGYERVVTAMRDADTRAASEGADPGERLRAQANAFCTFAATERGVIRLMFGHNASSFGEPDEAHHPAGLLWRQWLDAVQSCENAGLHWPDGAEQAALHLWSALFGRFALWASPFTRHEPKDLTSFADLAVDMVLRDARR
ncbi:TetR/AcrR family transcriptional regulator [Streptomyces sp. LBUM 1476]|nr:TetR/AcrR family transcriptional regulator [Streptomyces sp. LBUM 1476]MBZ3909863.1 TetR/AcrR family transcriptional regulator [Streptomyces acidiscabies]GAQ54578.1 DNA-binding transcriptional repressor FabR [Streptomyces acidiscabies]GAV41922.1 DNA-binding transcriptional repressor FabR [Streptomyces acidiscabies]